MKSRLVVSRLAAGVLTLFAAGMGESADKRRLACGTSDARLELALEVHERAARRASSLAAAPTSRADRVGNLAVIEAEPSLVMPPNGVDLHGATLRFSSDRGVSYAVSRETSTLDDSIGRTYNLGDDDTREIELLFPFTFYGIDRERVFVNSNGNLTFGESDEDYFSSDSDMLEDPPRIAPFFADLDPSAGGTVRIASQPDRLVATWERVPVWGTKNENTFQVELRDDGDIVMRFGDRLDANAAVVGLSSGSRANARIVDLTQTTSTSSGALFERFYPDPVVDTVATIRRFYEDFSDDYDAVILWTSFPSDLDDAFAYHVMIKNDVQGIGHRTLNRTAAWGSHGKLQSFVLMGNLEQYPDDPYEPIVPNWIDPLTLLAHEIGHRWLAFAHVVDEGARSSLLLGRQSSHWSFFLDSSGSFLEGNDFEEEAPGRFRSLSVESRYSPLDLYLMGLADAGEVGPFVLIEDGAGEDDYGRPFTNESSPLRGAVVKGKGEARLVDDVIAAEGPRVPDVDGSQKSFRHAFLLLAQPDDPPSGELLHRLDAIRSAWEGFFQAKTLGRATVDATLE